jgi:hypothetical protein
VLGREGTVLRQRPRLREHFAIGSDFSTAAGIRLGRQDRPRRVTQLLPDARHTHEEARALEPQVGQQLALVRAEQDVAPGPQLEVEAPEALCDMGQWKVGNHAVSAEEEAHPVEGFDLEEEVGVSQDDPFGHAGRARGVDVGRHVVATGVGETVAELTLIRRQACGPTCDHVGPGDVRAGATAIHTHDSSTRVLRQSATDAVGRGRICADHHDWLSVRQDVCELLVDQRRIQAHGGRSAEDRRQVCHVVLDDVRRQNRHRVARLYTHVEEPGGHGPDLLTVLSPVEGLRAVLGQPRERRMGWYSSSLLIVSQCRLATTAKPTASRHHLPADVAGPYQHSPHSFYQALLARS